MVIALYAKGLTTRDIAEWLQQTYGAKISHETVANITDSVNELVKAWRLLTVAPDADVRAA